LYFSSYALSISAGSTAVVETDDDEEDELDEDEEEEEDGYAAREGTDVCSVIIQTDMHSFPVTRIIFMLCTAFPQALTDTLSLT
jgi:hypothetical protein